MTRPTVPLPVPPVVTALAAGRPVEPVWLNELGGVTFAIADGAEYVKTGCDFADEARRLAWAARYVTVPRVLGRGPDWLHLAGLPGRSAVDPHWVARPQQAARAIGSGLRRLHDALPVDSCPFEWTVPIRLAAVTPAARAQLADPPPVDRLVVCHGDACAPNTLIDAAGGCAAHVDLGALGVADRWADLAVATMSLAWNYPVPDQQALSDELLGAYGLEADAVRIDYYRRLWAAPEGGAG